MNNRLLFGADPECASLDSNGNAIPPYWFRKVLGVPCTDDPKHPIFLQDSWWKAHEDGANFEFALRPSHNPMDLFDEIQFVRN